MKRYLNYISEVMCANCRNRARIKIPTNVPIGNKRCPKCGLRELHLPSYFGLEEKK